MGWVPVRRNPVERDVRIETRKGVGLTTGAQLRVELYRGGTLQAVREYPLAAVSDACDLAKRWLLLGPAIFTLEREPFRHPTIRRAA